MAIRVEAGAVYVPAHCLEQSTRAPGDDAEPTSSSGWCVPRRRRRRRPRAPSPSSTLGDTASLPARQLVGAEADASGRVRVWYTEQEQDEQQRVKPGKQLRGYVCPPPLRVRVSAPVDAGAHADAVVAAVRAAARGSQRPHKPLPRVVAIANPVSGRGRALRDFEREARPLLERAAGLRVTLLPTRRAGHARELARALEVDGGGGDGGVVLAVVGGDGTLHEVINGLLSRPDWRRVCCGGGGDDGQAPALLRLAHVPCGSGNGVAVSCGLRDAATAAAAIAKGCSAKMDVTSVLVRTAGGRMPTAAVTAAAGGGAAAAAAAAAAPDPLAQPHALTRTFCALSVAYGMLANLDVRTEPLRFLGEARFTLGGALEILRATSYACRAAWAPPTDAGAASGFLGEEDVGDEEDGAEEEQGGYTPPAAGSALLAGGRARSCDLLAATEAAAGGGDGNDDGDDDLLGDGGPPLPVLARLLRSSGGEGGRTLPERIPSSAALKAGGWRPLPVGPGVHLYSAVGPPYVAGNYRFNPLGALSSGALRQQWVPGHAVRGLAGRLASLALQDGAADGTHLDAAAAAAPQGGAGGAGGLMRHAPAVALALEPLAGPGETWVQLDGEVVRGAVPGAALWAEVHPGLLSVVVRPGHAEAVA
jgi:sphingosine kinase